MWHSPVIVMRRYNMRSRWFRLRSIFVTCSISQSHQFKTTIEYSKLQTDCHKTVLMSFIEKRKIEKVREITEREPLKLNFSSEWTACTHVRFECKFLGACNSVVILRCTDVHKDRASPSRCHSQCNGWTAPPTVLDSPSPSDIDLHKQLGRLLFLADLPAVRSFVETSKMSCSFEKTPEYDIPDIKAPIPYYSIRTLGTFETTTLQDLDWCFHEDMLSQVSSQWSLFSSKYWKKSWLLSLFYYNEEVWLVLNFSGSLENTSFFGDFQNIIWGLWNHCGSWRWDLWAKI